MIRPNLMELTLTQVEVWEIFTTWMNLGHLKRISQCQVGLLQKGEQKDYNKPFNSLSKHGSIMNMSLDPLKKPKEEGRQAQQSKDIVVLITQSKYKRKIRSGKIISSPRRNQSRWKKGDSPQEFLSYSCGKSSP